MKIDHNPLDHRAPRNPATRRTALTLAALLVSLAGCGSDSCPEGRIEIEGRCVLDPGDLDAGDVDASTSTDAGSGGRGGTGGDAGAGVGGNAGTEGVAGSTGGDRGSTSGASGGETDAGVGVDDVWGEVHVPPSGLTNADAIRVRGVAGARGSAAVARVLVNGREATLESGEDGTLRWGAELSLRPGSTRIEVTIEDVEGGTFVLEDAPRISREVLWGSLHTVESAPGSNLIYLADTQSVYSVHPTTGERRLVSGSGRGSGPELAQPVAMAYEVPGYRLYLLDRDNSRVLRIDTETGDRTVISGGGVGDGPELDHPVSMAIGDGHLFICQPWAAAGTILEIDLRTGDRAVVRNSTSLYPAALGIAHHDLGRLVIASGYPSRGYELIAHSVTGGTQQVISRSFGQSLGDGPAFDVIQAVALSQHGEEIYVLERDQPTILTVSRQTSDRQILTDPSHGQGLVLEEPVDISMDVGVYELLVADRALGAVVAIDTRSGSRRSISRTSHGEGPILRWVRGYALAPNGSTPLLALEGYSSKLLEVDRLGNRAAIPGAGRVPGHTLTWREDGQRVYLARNAMVWELDPSTGDYHPVTGPDLGSGPTINEAAAVVHDGAENRLIVASTQQQGLVAVDLSSGDRVLLSGESFGNGPQLRAPKALWLDAHNHRALVVDTDLPGLVAVDLESGERTLILGQSPRVGDVGLVRPESVMPSHDPRQIYVADRQLRALLRVDLQTGEATVVSGGEAGVGTGPGSGSEAAVVDLRRRISFGGGPGLTVIDLESGQRIWMSR